MYLYLFRQFTYGTTHRCKVGVSKNPEKRRFNYPCGDYEFYRKWPVPSRAAAFALEALVIKQFPAWSGRELLDAEAFEVAVFIDSVYSEFCLEYEARQ